MKKNLLFAVLFMFISACNADIFVRYKGLDNVHLEFWNWENFPATIRIKVAETGDILFEQTLPPEGGNITGKIRHTGLIQGTYTYQLWADAILRSATTAQINGTIGGELLYDETINDTAFLESNVAVPANMKLIVNGNLIKGDFFNNNIYVSGTINIGKGISLQEVNIHFQGESVDISDIDGNGNLLFYSQASGSKVEDCKGQLGITVKENASVSIKNSEIGGFGMEMTGTSLNIDNSIISANVNLTKIQNFEAKDSTFLSQVYIVGGSPKFNACEFVNSVNLYRRNSGEFINCVFGSPLVFYDPDWITDVVKWSEQSEIQPVFSNNSFAGRQGPVFSKPAAPFSPIDLGTNYYGDKKPVIISETFGFGSGPRPGWFLTRGVPIDRNDFRVTQWNTSGPEMKSQKNLPSFWLNDYVIGQNCISHLPGAFGQRKTPVLIKGRESLLSLDVATNYTAISGVTFKAIFDGQEILPENPNVILKRDISGSPGDIFYGNTTINFILPPTDKDIVSLQVTMDTTNIPGFEGATGKGESIILNENLNFSPEYGRQLNILVQPVQLYITGYTRKTPDGKSVENALKRLIPAMLPISSRQIHIWTVPPVTFYGGVLSMFSTTALLNRIANWISTTQGFINTTASIGDWLTGNETARIDFVIAVMPNGVMGEGITGANLTLRRGVIFVDESFADAALHEIGHGIGLYTFQEQYNQYPPAGIAVEGLTAFINENKSSSIGGFRKRFLHFPRKEQSWYQDQYWFDIMGSSSTLIWPIESTFLQFRQYLENTLGAETKSFRYASRKVPDGYKRIFISGTTEKVEDAITYYRFVQGTISAFDITEFATGKVDVPSEMFYWPSDDYRLECYDNTGTIIHTQDFTVISPYRNFDYTRAWPEESSFHGTFDIPEQTKTMKIFHRLWWNVWDENPVFEKTYTEPESISIISPLPATQLSDSAEIRWKTSETKQTSSMQYAIMVSPDNGETWFPIGAPVQSNKITIPTDFIPSSDNIIFKVVGSNGLGTTSAEAGNLVMQNRPPDAKINAPQNGWIAPTGTKWILSGYGIDNEDGFIPEGVWTSSIDGKINTETDVVLSPGVHILKFEVKDSEGLADSETVIVEVKEITSIDIGLNDTDLSLYISGKDPLNTSPVVWLSQNGLHRAVLKIRNAGTDTIFTASMYLTTPSDSEQLLATGQFTPEPFEDVLLSETFIVTAAGQYQIRAEITEIIPVDTNPSNNQNLWIYQTQPSTPLIGVLPNLLEFGNAKSRKQGLLLIKNYGNANLLISSLVISGQNVSEFSIDQSILQIPIPSNSSIFIPVYFNPVSTGSKQATLTISSNDTQNPTINVNFTGTCIKLAGDVSGDSSVDISDVILCLRQAIGLDPVDTEIADMNEDGNVDISDVILILRKAIGLD